MLLTFLFLVKHNSSIIKHCLTLSTPDFEKWSQKASKDFQGALCIQESKEARFTKVIEGSQILCHL